MIVKVRRADDTLSLIGVTSAPAVVAATTVVTRTSLAKSEGPRGEPGAFDAAGERSLKQEIRLGFGAFGSLTLDQPTHLVMRGNAAFSVTARSDKRTLVTLWCCRVSRHMYAREDTR